MKTNRARRNKTSKWSWKIAKSSIKRRKHSKIASNVLLAAQIKESQQRTAVVRLFLFWPIALIPQFDSINVFHFESVFFFSRFVAFFFCLFVFDKVHIYNIHNNMNSQAKRNRERKTTQFQSTLNILLYYHIGLFNQQFCKQILKFFRNDLWFVPLRIYIIHTFFFYFRNVRLFRCMFILH